MSKWDKMYIKIYNILNADVYLAKGFGYKWLNHLDQMVNDGDVFDTAAEWQFYVVGVANSMFKGTFSMKIWVEQNKEPKPKTPEKEVTVVKEVVVPTIVEEEEQPEEDTSSTDE